MTHNIKEITDYYHGKLVRDGYSVLGKNAFPDITGKFSLYAIHHPKNRERLIQVQDFHEEANAASIIRSLNQLDKAKTQIELSTMNRRSASPSKLELEVVALNVTPITTNEFCKQMKNAQVEYKNGILHAYIVTDSHQLVSRTRRFVLT